MTFNRQTDLDAIHPADLSPADREAYWEEYHRRGLARSLVGMLDDARQVRWSGQDIDDPDYDETGETLANLETYVDRELRRIGWHGKGGGFVGAY